MIGQLREDLVFSFGQHYLLNDPAHREDHFEEVYQTGVEINERLGLGIQKDLIMYAAYIHDLFAWSRANHHILSMEFVKSSDHPILRRLTSYELDLLSDACFCHRASYKGELKNNFSNLINSADRGRPTSVGKMLDRAIAYRTKKEQKETTSEILLASISHIKEKYGTKGYARYPDMYLSCYEKELNNLRKEIDQL